MIAAASSAFLRVGRLAKRPYHHFDRWRHAKTTGCVPWSLTQSIQRGLLRTTYKGVPFLKHPIDQALYTDLVWRVKPKLIVEIGSGWGGSALWFADLLRSYGLHDSTILSFDIKKINVHDPLVVFSQISLEDFVHCSFEVNGPILVIEDSSHTYRHSKMALDFFGPKLRKGDYIVVEDGNVLDLGQHHKLEGGPLRAIHDFLRENKDYRRSSDFCDRYGYNFTANPDGYLEKVR